MAFEKTSKRASPALTVIATSLLSLGVCAQESVLKDVVVSASKIEQSTMDAPSNVTVISSEKIENANATRLGDVLTAQVPGVYIRGSGLGTTTRDTGSAIMSLRGGYGTRTKVLVDGIASLADGNAGSLNLSTVSLADVDRVEIVPGVSSALYGSDAIGGVINIITKVPTKRELTARYTAGFEDGEIRKYEFGYRDKFENGLGISTNYYYQTMDGFANDFLTTSATTPCTATTCPTTTSGWRKVSTTSGGTQYIIGDRGYTPTVSQNFNGTLFYDLSPTSKLKAGMSYFESVTGYTPYNLYLQGNNGAVGLPASNLNVDGTRVASLNEGSLSLPGTTARTEKRSFFGYEGKVGENANLKVDLSRFDRDTYSLAKGTTTASTYSGGPGTSTHTPNVIQDAQAQLSFPLGQDHFLVSGLAYNSGELNRRVYVLNDWRNDGSRASTSDSADGYTRTYSAYVQDQYAVSNASTLYLGARYDNWGTHGTKLDAAGVSTTVPDRTQDAVSPRLALVHKLTDSISLKTSAGTAFHAPALYDMYASDNLSGTTRLLRSDVNLKPERAKSIDFGTEIGVGNGGVIKAAYFYTRITDMIYSKETPYTGPYNTVIPNTVTTLSTKTNAAEGVTKGIELSGEYPLANWLRVNGSYTYTDARITKDDTGTGMMGKNLVYVPRNMMSLGIDGKYHGWSYFWQSRYTGTSYSTALNTDSQTDVFGGVSRYWISNMKVSYQIDKNFKASFLLNNVFDKTYYEYYLMPGRNAAIQLSASI